MPIEVNVMKNTKIAYPFCAKLNSLMGLAVFTFFVGSISSLEAAPPIQGIKNTVHNLATYNVDGSMNGEVCAFCHTPHAANTAFYSEAPLWNKGAALQTNFTMYGATAAGTAGTTIAGTATGTTVGSSSAICLSCHDGVSAVNSIVNKPGSGGYVPAGQIVNYRGNTTGWTMPGVFAIGAGGDMTNDHPISLPYRGNEANPPASLRPTATPLVDWLGATTVADLLRGGNIECVSCHNPHSQAQSFLRSNNNQQSVICLACHAK